MVSFCCAYGCSAASDVYRYLIFHRFPDAVKDRERHFKWINAIKRKDFKPSKSTRLCSAHFKPSDYDPPVISGPPRLKKDAVPSVFDFPDHLIPKKIPEREPVECYIPEPESSHVIQETTVAIDEKAHSTVGVQTELLGIELTATSIENIESYSTVGVQTTLTGIELRETISDLRREKHILQQQIRRRNQRLMQMTCKRCGYKNEDAIRCQS